MNEDWNYTEFVDNDSDYPVRRDLRQIYISFAQSKPKPSISRGVWTRELLNVKYNVPPSKNHHMPTITPYRWENLVFGYVEGLWILQGKRHPDMLVHYAKDLGHYVNQETGNYDGAYGWQFGDVMKGSSQWRKVFELLSKDKESRRGIMTTYDHKNYYSLIETKDVPCNPIFQFLVRDERVHLFVNSRSSDLWRGFVYDTLQFTWFRDIMAGWLEFERGNFFYNINSLHLYESDNEQFAEVLEPQNLQEETVYPDIQPNLLSRKEFLSDFARLSVVEDSSRKGRFRDIMNSDFKDFYGDFYENLARAIYAHNLFLYRRYEDCLEHVREVEGYLQISVLMRLFAAIKSSADWYTDKENKEIVKTIETICPFGTSFLNEYQKRKGLAIMERQTEIKEKYLGKIGGLNENQGT